MTSLEDITTEEMLYSSQKHGESSSPKFHKLSKWIESEQAYSISMSCSAMIHLIVYMMMILSSGRDNVQTFFTTSSGFLILVVFTMIWYVAGLLALEKKTVLSQQIFIMILLAFIGLNIAAVAILQVENIKYGGVAACLLAINVSLFLNDSILSLIQHSHLQLNPV